VYLDSCAAIKLFKQEVESDALSDWLVEQVAVRQITCHLTRTELRRGLHAAGAAKEAHQQVDQWLSRCAHVALPVSTYDRAGELAPGTSLRSLDALHVAAASTLGASLAHFVSYDKRMLDTAARHGLPAVTPGA
jgi:predicted nucleic acid-binding protein